MHIHRFAKIRSRHMQIHLRAGDRPVTQKMTDRHQLLNRFHQMRCKGVPELVRRHPLGDLCLAGVSLHPLIDSAAITQVRQQFHEHTLWDRNHSLAISLAFPDCQLLTIPIHILQVQPAEFIGPQSTSIQQQHDEPIPPIFPVSGRTGLHQTLCLFFAQRCR